MKPIFFLKKKQRLVMRSKKKINLEKRWEPVLAYKTCDLSHLIGNTKPQKP